MMKLVSDCIWQSAPPSVGDEACLCLCLCASHTGGFSDPLFFFFSPWVCFVQPEPAKTSVVCLEVWTWLLPPHWRAVVAPHWVYSPPLPPAGARPYSGCSGCVCRPFSGRLMVWRSQKALCNWSSSDISGRPMSKCIFRFCSHSSSLEKAGLSMKEAETQFCFNICTFSPQEHFGTSKANIA